MPIKEIIAITTAFVALTAVTGGPSNLTLNLNKMKYHMLKELTRTDNWGNPSPWSNLSRPHAKNVFTVQHVRRPSTLNANPRK